MSMTVPDILRECHRLRVFRRELQSEIELGPRVQKMQQAELEKQRQTHKDAHDTLNKLKLKVKSDEGTLKQLEAHLNQLHFRSLQVTTMREMEATRLEIAQATEKKNALEETILSTMAEIDERTADLPNVEARWKKAQEDFARQQEEAKERLERLKQELDSSAQELERLESHLPAKVKAVYVKLVTSYGPDGIAAVKERVCQFCRTTLPEQKWIELRNGVFHVCSECGRALYPD